MHKTLGHWIFLSLGFLVVAAALSGMFVPAVADSRTATHTQSLDRRIAIYIPGTVNGNQPDSLRQEEMTAKVLEKFARWFGGATTIAGEGAWMGEQGLVREPVRIVYSFLRPEALRDHLEEALDLAKTVCGDMSQESVCLEIDSRLHFVTTQTQRSDLR